MNENANTTSEAELDFDKDWAKTLKEKMLHLDTFVKDCRNICASYGTMCGVSLNQWHYLKESMEKVSPYIDECFHAAVPIEIFRLYVMATFFHRGYTAEHHPQCNEHWEEWKHVSDDAYKWLAAREKENREEEASK